MDNKLRIGRLREGDYLETFGVRKPTFEKMLSILGDASAQLHGRGGRPPRLSVLDKPAVTLGHYHDYRTMRDITFDYGVSKSRISDAVKRVGRALLRGGAFALPSKRRDARRDAPKKSAGRIPGRRGAMS